MKKLILFLLLTIFALGQVEEVHAQKNKSAIFLQQLSTGTEEAPYEFTYTDIPARPALGTSATITWSSPGNILNTTGGDTQDKIISGTGWLEFHAFSFVGTAGTYRRISNENSTATIGSVANQLFTREGTNSTYFELNGKSSTEPLHFIQNTAAATSAIQLSAFATGPYVRIQNVVNDSRGYAIFANTAGTLSGGNSTTPPTSANNYQGLPASYVRSFSPTTDKEHFYYGATTTSTYAIHQDLDLSHLLGYSSEWDGIQIQNAVNFTLTKSTFVNSGTDNTASQNASLQVQNSYGTVEDCIFYNAPQGLRFSTHNLTFNNNYVHWTANTANQFISYYGNYASTNRLMVDPIVTTVTISNCDFKATTWTGALFDVLDPNVNITITNCRIEGPTSLFQDSRGGSPTGTLTDGGGNTFVSSGTIPVPTFSNFTPTDFTGHGLLTEATHHALGRGYRTPN